MQTDRDKTERRTRTETKTGTDTMIGTETGIETEGQRDRKRHRDRDRVLKMFNSQILVPALWFPVILLSLKQILSSAFVILG